MHSLADAARAARALQSAATVERLHVAHRSAPRGPDADDPWQLQTDVMVAAVDDAVAALRPLAGRHTPD
jgi:hypothetical protein